jgi:hypothetical protein
MRFQPRGLVIAPLVAAMLVACGGAAAPSPSRSPEAEPPADAKVRLRVTAVQALPPTATFNWMPQVLITLDGKVLQGGAIPAIFPGPLVNPIFERQISAEGWARIVEMARAAGLLGFNSDFTGGQMPPGSQVTRLELVADGRVFDLTGDASRQMVCVQAPCNPAPGTPEAFAGFVNQLYDLPTMVGAGSLGPELPHNPAGYGVLVGGPPDDQGIVQRVIDWPLPAGFGAFGKPLADGTGGRCGTITGADVGLVRPAFTAATQITPWRDPVEGSEHGLVVRPLLPGDADPCEGLV